MSRGKDGRKPGIPAAGAIDLSQLNQRVPVRTEHETKFQGCKMGFFQVVGPDRVVQGYLVRIEDPADNHTYSFAFGPEVLQDFQSTMAQFSNVGEVVPEDG